MMSGGSTPFGRALLIGGAACMAGEEKGWQQQLLPEHLASDDRLHAAKAAGGGDALPLVVVEYPPAPEEGLEQLVEALELH